MGFKELMAIFFIGSVSQTVIDVMFPVMRPQNVFLTVNYGNRKFMLEKRRLKVI
jgi:hypothetical protein